MKGRFIKHNILIILFLGYITSSLFPQFNPSDAYPQLFKEVQKSWIFEDQKKFVDCIPKVKAESIDQLYLSQKGSNGFKLKDFVGQYFDTLLHDTSQLVEHIHQHWYYLTRNDSLKTSQSSLIPLPFSYVVPGGRFREIYYWDSYFTMLGLAESGRLDLIENMLNNFAYLIDSHNHIPNGNRTYYLSRSQPPFFSLMVELLAELKGDTVYIRFLPHLKKEYEFWMKGNYKGKNYPAADKHCVFLDDGVTLNRYWDPKNEPRPESYLQDWEVYQKTDNDSIYHDIRAAAESGWDFSGRWFADNSSLSTIETTSIIPVDLNCLLFHLEKTLAKAYRISGNEQMYLNFNQKAKKRSSLINKYLWNKEKGFYFDYHFIDKRQTGKITMAAMFPLFFGFCEDKNAYRAIEYCESHLIKEGGFVTTDNETGQQWDYPNGWAPLQWMGYVAYKNYGHSELAREIAERWINQVVRVYFETGKLMEKYNVVETNLPGGGGEYPLQDGFGWTNGVFLKLWNELK